MTLNKLPKCDKIKNSTQRRKDEYNKHTWEVLK